MLLQVASDLHLERLENPRTPDALLDRVKCDVLVLAGDIDRLERVAGLFSDWPVPIVYVHGNHELYHRDCAVALRHAQEQYARTSIHFLEEQERVIDNVRFLGCCLWTDFALHGTAGPAMSYAQDCAPDYKIIFNGGNRRLTPADTRRMHRASVEWLESKMRQPFPGKTVVVTHYAPHPMSLGYQGARASAAAFASDLGRLLRWADLWIHGHIHESCDYMLGGCRVVANPAGYKRNGSVGKITNRKFDRGLVVQI
ncbi:metallophosphoesterase [Paraburkholderia guartelaensis]|uniref:metallophosphoesterase n=1 Tax=Paraburkholderia guartelaensis TaxID=2546446 RepID=UPI002AB66DF4|nr:metallophosphoesterase [Paraburkholderia guartelaensis]